MDRTAAVIAFVMFALSVGGRAAAQQPATAPAAPPAPVLESRLRALPPGTPAGPFVTLNDGAILGVQADAALVTRDGGQTWERHPMFAPGAFKVRPEYAIARAKDGAVVVVFMDDLVKEWKWDAKANASAVAEPRLFVWATRSADGGRTWSPPKKIQDGYCGAVRDMILTRDGHLVVPLQKFLTEHQRHATTPMVSTDDGKTWRSAGVLDIGRGRGHHDGSIEACAYERRDGTLVMLLRTCEDAFYQSLSTDGGQSWQAMTPTAIDASSSPAIVKRLASGRLMMAWNRLYPEGRGEYPRRGGQHSAREASWHREELSVAFSDDDGATWSKPAVVARTPEGGKWLAYPFIVEPRPGVVWLSTMQGGLRAELREDDFVAAERKAEAPQPPRRVGVPGANEAVVVRLPDDEMRVYYVRRPEGNEIRSMGSRDGGRTWGDDRTEFAVPGAAYYGVQVAVDRHGELQCVFHVLGKGDNGYRGRHYDLWHARTTGGRKAWTTPTKFYDGYVGSIRGFVKLKSGRLLLSVSVAVPAREPPPAAGEPDYGWNDAVVFYSDDDGQSWQQGQDRLRVLQDPERGKTRYGAVEPHLVELRDGRVWMIIRTKNGHFWESTSTDGGTTWPQPTPSQFISSDSPAASARLRDGRLALFLNACQRWDDLRSYAIGGRHVLHAAISDDDGRTWRGFREVLHDDQSAERGDRGTAYPTAAEAPDGQIVLVSGQGEGKKHILLIDPDWIAEGSQSDDFSAGLAQWTTFEGTGAQVIDAGGGGARALAVAQADPATAAGAVWNFPMAPAGEMSIRVKRNGGAAAKATLALSDHYAVVADAKAEANAVYALNLADVLPDADWHDVKITWSPGAPAAVTVDGRPAASLAPIRTPAFGVNYLRLRSFDAAGITVARVSASAAPAAAQPGAGAIEFRRERGPADGGATLGLGPAGAFDERWATCPSVLRDGGRYRMWYSGPFTASAGEGGIGLAESDDGQTWRRAGGASAALLPGPAGAFDERQVFAPEVRRVDDGRYLMWYTGESAREHPSGIVTYQVGVCSSDDGVRWTRENAGRPVLAVGPAGAPDEVQAATPTVLRDGDGWRMWYAAWAPGHGHTVCTARSGDGVNWTRDNAGRPVEGLDPAEAYGPAVERVGGRFVMLYMALRATRGLYAAESADGQRWRMLNAGQPVLLAAGGASGAFDADMIGHPCLLVDDGSLRAWYTGYQTAAGGLDRWRLRIGAARASLDSL